MSLCAAEMHSRKKTLFKFILFERIHFFWCQQTRKHFIDCAFFLFFLQSTRPTVPKMAHGLATMNLSAEPRASNKPRLRLPWKKVSEDVGKNRPQDRWHVSFEQIRAMNDIQKRVMSGTEHKVAQVRNAKVILDCWGWYPRLRALRLLLEINYFKCHIFIFKMC